MSDKRYAIMFIRLGLLASILFAIFWIYWHLSGHQVPVYTNFKITENTLWTFPISRWWDIPFAFLLVNTYAWILRIYYKVGLKFANREDIVFGLGVGLGVGFVAGLVAGLGVGFVAGLVAGLGVGLGVGLGAGLGAGLVVGLVVGLVAGLVAGLGVGLCLLIKVLFSSNFWKSVYNWFAAKNIA